MKKSASLILLAVLSALFFGCEKAKPVKAAGNSAPEPSKIQAAAETADITAPDFELKDIFGKPLKLSDHKGKVIILDFWATWCPPCKAEIPFFIELQKEHADKILIIGLALENDPSKVIKFYKDNKMNYPVAMSPQDLPMIYGGIQGIPTTFIIDKDGKIRDKYVGFRPKSVFEEAFHKLR